MEGTLSIRELLERYDRKETGKPVTFRDIYTGRILKGEMVKTHKDGTIRIVLDGEVFVAHPRDVVKPDGFLDLDRLEDQRRRKEEKVAKKKRWYRDDEDE